MRARNGGVAAVGRFPAFLVFLGILLCLRLGAATAEPPLPPLTGRVVDLAEILSAATESGLSDKLAAHEAASTNQIVVVTLPDLQSYPIEDWGLALGRGWGIGQAGKDNGVLLIVAPNERELRIEVGYGLEGVLPDAIANAIIQNEIIPRFKDGDMEGGVTAGADAIIAAIGGAYQPTEAGQGFWGFLLNEDNFSTLFFVAFIAIFILTSLHRRWNPALRRHSWYLDLSSRGGRGGGFSGGSSGGGFSGGGGSFGGGGASGRW
jgi:uncharacterized protein